MVAFRLSSYVNLHVLWRVTWVSLVVSVGLCVVFGVGLAGAQRYADARGEGRTSVSGLLSAAVAALLVVAAAVWALMIMLHKH